MHPAASAHLSFCLLLCPAHLSLCRSLRITWRISYSSLSLAPQEAGSKGSVPVTVSVARSAEMTARHKEVRHTSKDKGRQKFWTTTKSRRLGALALFSPFNRIQRKVRLCRMCAAFVSIHCSLTFLSLFSAEYRNHTQECQEGEMATDEFCHG